jgi:hypothetical protein
MIIEHLIDPSFGFTKKADIGIGWKIAEIYDGGKI